MPALAAVCRKQQQLAISFASCFSSFGGARSPPGLFTRGEVDDSHYELARVVKSCRPAEPIAGYYCVLLAAAPRWFVLETTGLLTLSFTPSLCMCIYLSLSLPSASEGSREQTHPAQPGHLDELCSAQDGTQIRASGARPEPSLQEMLCLRP